MRKLKNLNVEKSIQLQKLVYTESSSDKFDKFIIYFLCCWGFLLPFLIYFDSHRDRSKTEFELNLIFIISIL
jgi:hypothetical protein